VSVGGPTTSVRRAQRKKIATAARSGGAVGETSVFLLSRAPLYG